MRCCTYTGCEKLCKNVWRQLNNTANYKHLQKGPAATNNELVHNVVKRFENEKLIQKNISKGVKGNSPRTFQIYTQAKIHKEGNLGKLVISSVNCHTTKILKNVDYHFQQIVKQISSYVKNTNQFISKLKAIETVRNNSYPVLLDAKSLYANISNPEGIKAMKTSLDDFPRKTVATKVVKTFLSLNNFIFNCI